MISPRTFIADPWDVGNPETLIMDPAHPGLNDTDYIARRQQLFNTARDYRQRNHTIPNVSYTEAEHALWRTIAEQLAPLHENYASTIYLTGVRKLQIETKKIPALGDLHTQLDQLHQIGLAPAEGLLHTRSFYHYLSQRKMPCTLFLRHPSQPAYTPEPDMVHDLIGHVPMLTDPDYADLIELIGQGVKNATEDQLIAWSRIYWFVVEFGLIEEKDTVKTFGAGLFSSIGEMSYSYSDHVQHKPFDLNEIIHLDYDTNHMQNVLFVLPPIKHIQIAIRQLLKNWYG